MFIIYNVKTLIDCYFPHSLSTTKPSIISEKNTAPVPFLKLEPSRSYMKPGDSLEIECSSSVGPHVAVKWERPGGHPLPYNFEVIFELNCG